MEKTVSATGKYSEDAWSSVMPELVFINILSSCDVWWYINILRLPSRLGDHLRYATPARILLRISRLLLLFWRSWWGHWFLRQSFLHSPEVSEDVPIKRIGSFSSALKNQSWCHHVNTDWLQGISETDLRLVLFDMLHMALVQMYTN